MIKLENYEVVGWEHAIRGMRNPKNSWERSDSTYCGDHDICDDCPAYIQDENGSICSAYKGDQPGDPIIIGENDHKLMMKLVKGGPVHAKYRRMITVEDFSCEQLPISYYDGLPTEDMIKTYPNGEMCYYSPKGVFKMTIDMLNKSRERFLKTNDKKYWWQMIQLLPSSYNQKRTIMLNYEVLANIYESRKNHKLDCWREFCSWIASLPYSEIITGDVNL